MRHLALPCLIAVLGLPSIAYAEVVASGPDHYELAHEASSARDVEAMWERLLDLPSWWQDAHTYSGDSDNLRLSAKAGGMWRERWSGGDIAHGRVMMIQPPHDDQPGMLRLDAPFGPLQDLGVTVVWTITVSANGEGSKVGFREVASGTERSGLDAMAGAVDYVKTEALTALVGE